MSTISEGDLLFHFRSNLKVLKYDDCQHHRVVLSQKPHYRKAVDFVVMPKSQNPSVCWLIEVKDFRMGRGQPKLNSRDELAEDVTRKFLDTLAGLEHAATHSIDTKEQKFAAAATIKSGKRCVFHMEPFEGTSKLFAMVPSPDRVLQQLRQRLIKHKLNPQVVSIARMKHANLPWAVT